MALAAFTGVRISFMVVVFGMGSQEFVGREPAGSVVWEMFEV